MKSYKKSKNFCVLTLISVMLFFGVIEHAEALSCSVGTTPGTCMADTACTDTFGGAGTGGCTAPEGCCTGGSTGTGTATGGAKCEKDLNGDGDATNDMQEINGVCVPTSDATGLSDSDGSDEPVSVVIITFMKWLLYVFGFLAIIAFVVSGIFYLTSAGNEQQAEKAKTGVIGAVIGVIVALSALVIINAIDNWLNGSVEF